MKNQKREMFVFVGQNASCGTPHPITGRMSYYGTIYRIDGTLKQAKEWAEMMEDPYSTSLCVAGSRRKMREFCQGYSMYIFEQDLDNAPTVHPHDDQNVNEWYVS